MRTCPVLSRHGCDPPSDLGLGGPAWCGIHDQTRWVRGACAANCVYFALRHTSVYRSLTGWGSTLMIERVPLGAAPPSPDLTALVHAVPDDLSRATLIPSPAWPCPVEVRRGRLIRRRSAQPQPRQSRAGENCKGALPAIAWPFGGAKRACPVLQHIAGQSLIQGAVRVKRRRRLQFSCIALRPPDSPTCAAPSGANRRPSGLPSPDQGSWATKPRHWQSVLRQIGRRRPFRHANVG